MIQKQGKLDISVNLVRDCFFLSGRLSSQHGRTGWVVHLIAFRFQFGLNNGLTE